MVGSTQCLSQILEHWCVNIFWALKEKGPQEEHAELLSLNNSQIVGHK